MKIISFPVFIVLACWTQSLAQDLESSPESQAVLDDQATGIFRALVPVVKKASAGTVEVRVWRKRVSYGTIVGPETVLTKWSEVSRDLRSLSCRTISSLASIFVRKIVSCRFFLPTNRPVFPSIAVRASV